MSIPFAFVSLVTSDHYLPGALAVAAALKDLHPTPAKAPEVNFQTVCLVTPESIDVSTIKLLRRAFNVVIGVELIEQEDEKGLQLLGRPDLSHVLTKLHIFRLTQYQKIIFLDADVLPIRPLSHLFNIPHDFAAVPDVGWPDIFNSGVLVLNPGQDKFDQLVQLLKTKGSWDGGDQGLLNEWRGGNWHRLSFTYNTTPTAAYTYAPAYERFGSQISAIHFIGPSKPWASLQYRAPGIKPSRQHDANVPQEEKRKQVYNFDSLVDRWFDVYDRYYRSDAPTARAEFEVRRYASVWDESGRDELGAELPPITLSGTATHPGGTLGLEDLRRIAVEGMSNMGSSVADTESAVQVGEYRSMPLGGRVDLMRPKPQPRPQTQTWDEHTGTGEGHRNDRDRDLTPTQEEYKQLHPSGGGDGPRMHTPPTPSPNEIPPAPYQQGRSSPPALSYPTQGEQWSGPESSQQQHQDQGRQHDSQRQQWQPEPEHQGTHHHHRQHQHQQPFRHQPPSPQNSSPEHEPIPMPSVYHRHSPRHSPGHSPQHHSPPYHQPQHHPHAHQHHQHHEHRSPPRPSSPPKLSWNPAIEPPPNNPPVVNAFPTDTYFPNVWDQSPSRQHDAAHQAFPSPPVPYVPAPHSDAFFRPPPPSRVPEQLLLQGQYSNVFGQAPPAGPGSPPAQPVPDPTKVQAVFPWEQKPQHTPKRVFPVSDAPPATKYIEDEALSSSGAQAEEALTPEQGSPDAAAGSPGQIRPALHVQAPTPPTIGLPGHLTYANAWDTVPSIQKYASKLVRPHHQYPFQHVPYQSTGSPRRRSAQWTDDDAWRRLEKERERVAQARQDASSMDGDDEDEGDDEDDWDGESKKDSALGTGSHSGGRSRSGSTASATAAKGRKYRGRGVQTIPVETRHQAVQVKIRSSSPDGDGPVSRDHKQPPPSTRIAPEKTKRDMASSPILAKNRLLPPPTLLPPAPVHEFRMDPDQMGQATPALSQSLKQTVPFPSSASPTGLRSPQMLGSPRTYSPPKALSPPKVPSPSKLSPPKVPSPPRVMSPPKVPTPAKISTPPMSGTASPARVPSTPKGASPRRLSSAQQQQFTTSRKSSFGSTPPSKPASPRVGPVLSSTPPPSTPSPKLPKLTSPFGPPMSRSVSNDTNLTSSPSTQGMPLTPESATAPPPPRKAGRVWDPARGVDVFKRSSEEVLARFLRMGPFEEDERRQNQVQQQQE